MNSSSIETGVNPRKRWIWLVVIAIVVIAAIVIFSIVSRSASPSELVIGIVFPMSGNLGYVGQMEADGMRLAVKDINAKANSKDILLRLQVDDSQGKPDIGVTATKKMMSVDKIKVIASSISGVTLGLKPVVETNNGILIGLCMHPNFYKDSPNTFRFYEGVEQESQGFIEYYRKLSAKNPGAITGVLYADVPNVREQLENYVRPELKKLKMDFKVAEPYQLSDKEFRDKVTKIKNAGITNLMLLGYGFEYPNIFKALKEQKVLPGVQIVGGWGFLYNKVPKEDLEGITVVGPSYVFEQPNDVKDFYTRFKTEFGYDANFDAAMTYAAVQLISEAIRKSKTITPEALGESLRSLRDVKTLIGITSVNDQGATEFKIGIGVFRNGMLIAR